MRLNRNNALGYFQAAISFFIILFTFLPYIDIAEGYYHDDISAMTSYTQLFVKDEKVHIGVFFVIFILIQYLNIFIQSKKNSAFAIFSGLFGLIPILMMHFYIDDIESEANEYYYDSINYNYTFGFYIIVVLAAAQTVLQTIAVLAKLNISSSHSAGQASSGNMLNELRTETEELKRQLEMQEAQGAHRQEKTGTERLIEKERLEKEQLQDEYMQLKAKAEQIEKERIEKERREKEQLQKEYQQLKAKAEQMERERLERERLEKERLEKEHLQKEIIRLKELLKKNETENEANS